MKKMKKRDTNPWIWLITSIIIVVLLIVLIFIFTRKPDDNGYVLKENLPEKPPEPAIEKNIPNPPTNTPNPLTPPIELIPYERRNLALDFNLEKIDGGTLSLSSLKGKIVLLDFTTTWCYWCDVQAPQVEELYRKYSNKGFTVISIDCREDLQTVRKKYPNGKHIFPVVLDKDGSVAYSYGIKGYPTYLLLDKEGKIAYVQEGYKENMEEIVSRIIDYLNIN